MKRFTRQQPGEPVSAKIINAPMDEIEANFLAHCAAGLGASRSRSGITLYNTQHLPTVIGLTTSSIGARFGDVPGHGSFKIQKFNGTELADVTSGTFTAYNLLDQAINNNHYVFLNWWGGYWWVVAVDACTAIAGGAALGGFDFLMTVSSNPAFDAVDSQHVIEEDAPESFVAYVAGAEV